MPLIDLKPGHTGPATHALVIGVGAYRHLLGGAQAGPDHWGLGQLPGAAHSAASFVKWLQERFHHVEAPLATIEHLITDGPGTALGSAEPTIEAISRAINAWRLRASSHPDNIAIFYFAGHGVLMGTETGLLAADFADPAYGNPTNQSIHVEELVQGMLSCKANKQCFIIDACRTTEQPLLTALGRPGISPVMARQEDVRPIPQPVVFATLLNQSAYQTVGAASPFTSALLESLEGLGADDVNGGYGPGECAVSASTLVHGINAAMALERLQRPFLLRQDVTLSGGGDLILHYPQDQIHVPLIVGCDPNTLNQEATLLVRQNSTVLHSRPPDDPDDFVVWVTPDAYETAASLTNGHVASKKVLVTPPRRVSRLSNFAPPAPVG